MEIALLVALIFVIASGLNRISTENFVGAAIRNDGGERIQSLEFEVPALRSDVLFYKAGELQSANPAISGRDFRLWYPPEEVSDKAFLKSLELAPIVVGTHEATTNEKNKKIDGWPTKVYYDATAKAAKIKGVIKGENEADYVRDLRASKDFGASGFIDARRIEIKEGTTPDGKPYDGIARDLFATHVALLPNVRDPNNRIETMNARAVVMNAGTLSECAADTQSNKNEKEGGGNMPDDKKPDENIENTVRNVLQKMEAEKSGAARMDSMEETMKNMKNTLDEFTKNAGKNAGGEGEGDGKKKDDPPADTTNGDGDVLKNAKASDETIKVFADALGLNPASLKNSTVKDLAKFAGVDVSGKSPIEVVQLVNAKAKELKGAADETTGATVENAEGDGPSQFEALLQRGA